MSSNTLAIGWLITLLLLLIIALINRPSVDSSILAMLPTDHQQPQVQSAQKQIGEHYAKQLLLLLQGQDDQTVRTETTRFAQELSQLHLVTKTLWQVEPKQLQRQRDFYFPHRFHLLDTQTRINLEKKDYASLRQQALLRLLSPIGGISSALIEDPFGLWQSHIAQLRSSSPIQVDKGLLRVPAAMPTYLITVTLSGNAFDIGLQNQLMPMLQRLESEANSKNVQLLKSGMLFHASAGTKQAKSEISTIGILSLLGILIITLLVYRNLRNLWLILLPLAVGWLAALAVTSLAFGKIHVITLAFGAGLVGVSVDYALHYLTEQHASGSNKVLHRILPGLILGLASSVFAYGSLILAPFPGLQQMACFSATGLIASWLSVVLWYPHLAHSRDNKATMIAVSLVHHLLAKWPTLSARQAQGLLIAIVAISATLLWHGTVRDDLRLLQSSPQALINQERQVSELLHQGNMSRFLLVIGSNTEQLLKREEAVIMQLQQLRTSFPELQFRSLSAIVPSIARQKSNYQAARELYLAEAGNLFRVLHKDALLHRAWQALDNQGSQRLLPGNLPANRLSTPIHLLTLPDATLASVISLSGLGEPMVGHIETIANQKNWVFYVDTVGNLSNLLGRYRNEIALWVSIAYLLVGCALVWRYRRDSWRVLGPPVAAGLCTAALLSNLGFGLNIFHLLAMLLVLGIGLDTGIFLQERSGAIHTWLAVCLSMLTSLLAFGLLSFSAIPILHYFGLTVLIGLSMIFLLSLCISKGGNAHRN